MDMKLRLLVSAFLRTRNLAVLLILSGLLLTAYPYLPLTAIPLGQFGPVAAVAAVYIALVFQSFFSARFYEEFAKKQKIKQIRNLNYMSIRLSSEARKYTNATYQQKLKKVMEDKDDIVNSFFHDKRSLRRERSEIEENVVEQALILAVSYVRLLINYCKRKRELESHNYSEIYDRINANKRKLNFVQDPFIEDDLRKTVEMDERLLERLKEERNELERIRARLDYLESMINMYKHRIISGVETEETVKEMENAVNEAMALDNALEEHRRSRKRI